MIWIKAGLDVRKIQERQRINGMMTYNHLLNLPSCSLFAFAGCRTEYGVMLMLILMMRQVAYMMVVVVAVQSQFSRVSRVKHVHRYLGTYNECTLFPLRCNRGV